MLVVGVMVFGGSPEYETCYVVVFCGSNLIDGARLDELDRCGGFG
jgi:hypothetical protein